MTATNFNVRLDQDLKERSFPVIESYGLTPAQAFKLFLNQIAETKILPLSFDYRKEQLTFAAQQKLQQSIQEIAHGDYRESTLEDLIAENTHA